MQGRASGQPPYLCRDFRTQSRKTRLLGDRLWELKLACRYATRIGWISSSNSVRAPNLFSCRCHLSSSSPNTRRRYQRRDPDHIERVTLNASLEMMRQRGITAREITLYEVANWLQRRFEKDTDHADRLSYGTIYRQWSGGDSTPSANFQRWLAERLQAGDEVMSGPVATRRAIEKLWDDIPVDPDERSARLLEIVRIAPAAALRAESESPSLRARLVGALTATDAESSSPTAWELDVYRKGYRPIYRDLMNRFGLQVRSGYDLDQFAISVAAVAEGFLTRSVALGRIAPVESSEDKAKTWDLFSLAVLALMHQYLEADRSHETPTELPRTT